ncbi:hypothetical protein [Flavobacterium sp. NKUCC04_CG]|uniref:hypothetical protein n=1 Tax=Flavobacterium sp. NKUCC04_CG TaxID=2842121 RepID=UPI001C5ABEA9|nr:hypothetical protein [Flavobacterium sp. NKUCC04_CG]MBW3518604.1 hypothetical protein [Flavobacterium sp. NKUCC04_CG]
MKTLINPTVVKYLDYIIRFYLSFSLLIYAVAKITNVQFSQSSDSYLHYKVEDLSPQDLVWVFYGYAPLYEIILGCFQLVAVFLLVYDKTKLLGILFLWPIFINILLIDIFYEVTALRSIIYYSVLLLILSFLNQKQLRIAIVQLVQIPGSQKGFLFNLKNLFIIMVGFALLILLSLTL